MLVDDTVINTARVGFPNNIAVIRGFQQTVLFEKFKVDKVRVACIDGEGLIGGIPIACRGKGKYLPAFDSRLFQKVNEFKGVPAHFADAVLRGQT